MITDLRQARLTVSDMERRVALMERLLVVPAFVKPPLPQFLPKSGVINQNIALNGSNFDVGAVEVRFGDKLAKIVGAASTTQVVAQVPSGLTPAGTPVAVNVTVKNPGGSDISVDKFTVLASTGIRRSRRTIHTKPRPAWRGDHDQRLQFQRRRRAGTV